MVTIRLVILTNMALYFFNICDFGGFFLFFIGLILTSLSVLIIQKKKKKTETKEPIINNIKNLSGVHTDPNY